MKPTNIYFVRHAEADNTVRIGRERPLTENGLVKRVLVTNYLLDKDIEYIFSSPFKRAYDTISDFAEKQGLSIAVDEGFGEIRNGEGMWRGHPEAGNVFKNQWNDFDYRFSDGESLNEVQNRNITALKKILDEHEGKNIAIATHSTSLSLILNYYDSTFSYEAFQEIQSKLPWVAKLVFSKDECQEIEKIDLY